MALAPADAWTWDFWLVDDGRQYHVYFLKAPRGPDESRRHWNVRIGHAVSPDLRRWEHAPDALAPSDVTAFDDLATWTGSVVRADDGAWHMFYTGAGSQEQGLKQRIGLATSADLRRWRRHAGGAVLESDGRWYEQLDDGAWPDEAWRDPWVFRDPQGDGWHMLITARAARGAVDQRGVVGHARSHDLVRWEAQPPLSAPGSGFGQLEVLQVEVVDGRPVLLFSCLARELADERRAAGVEGGIWCVPTASVTGPYDVARARRVTGESLYSGRLIRDRSGSWVMLAFRNGVDGAFVGGLSPPMPVAWADDGARLVLASPRAPSA